MRTKRFTGPAAWNDLRVFQSALEQLLTRIGGHYEAKSYHARGTATHPDVLLEYTLSIPRAMEVALLRAATPASV